MTQGNTVLAEALAKQGIKSCCGIVGIPVIELGYALQGAGINYYGFRNEQAASYAAGAIGYMTNMPGLCLSVSGPGMTNCISGLANALTNCWPMILIGGSSDLSQKEMGAFQELDQVAAAKPYCKLAFQITDVRSIPYLVEKAVKVALSGRPGPVYIDAPGDILSASVPAESIVYLPQLSMIPKSVAPASEISKTIALLRNAKRPLVIVGKGASYTNSNKELTEFINLTNLPFLPTPMGKGVVSDFHKNNVGPARSTALSKSDVIVLVGARLNWILHFGKPPRFDKDVKIVQIDVNAEEMGTNVRAEVALLGDCSLIAEQLSQCARNEGWKFTGEDWWKALNAKKQANVKANEELMNEKELPLQYYSAYSIINRHLPKDHILVGEGANTMDIGRTIIMHDLPKHRLDAGTFGTMGLGIPFCIAAKIVNPTKPVVAVMGDSAFGFSAMELDTAARYNLNLIVIILNNNGIYSGVESIDIKGPNNEIPVTALNPDVKYEKIAEAFNGSGYAVRTHEELDRTLKEAFANQKPLTIINVAISPYGVKKPQEHAWLTRENPQSKL